MSVSLLQKRRKELRTELSLIEKQIFDLESTYLEDTKEFGNIFTGWDSYLSKEKIKLKTKITNEDRLFSLSSVTSPASRRDDSTKNNSKNNNKKKRTHSELEEDL
jgi:chromatin modification-related protein EAF6